MVFKKSFPKEVPNSRFPEWVEVELSDAHEAEVEAKARQDNIRIMKECLSDAAQIVKDEHLKNYQTDLVKIAACLFDKRASHVVYHKEAAARDKFEKGNK